MGYLSEEVEAQALIRLSCRFNETIFGRKSDKIYVQLAKKKG